MISSPELLITAVKLGIGDAASEVGLRTYIPNLSLGSGNRKKRESLEGAAGTPRLTLGVFSCTTVVQVLHITEGGKNVSSSC